jgi:hypothetical protein
MQQPHSFHEAASLKPGAWQRYCYVSSDTEDT